VEKINIEKLGAGIGFDIHKTSIKPTKQKLKLLGLEWENYPRLIGHSDGDCAIHALTDAILSASKLGDIGHFLGHENNQNKGISGQVILEKLKNLLNKEKIKLINASVQVICQKPNINQRRFEAEKVLSTILKCPISVLATTTDKLGEIGKNKAIASQAIALVIK
jgi:2-C-methyl-D-erythritol 2,4-cyclodiphosphate synthase